MKRSFLVTVLLIALSCVTLQHVAMAEPSADLVERVTRLAHVNDLMGDELEEVKQLRATADERFHVFAQIIESAQDDAVINTAMSFAESAQKHKDGLSEIASKLLLKRDASLFPSATQRALAILGNSGHKKHIPQIQPFASNPQVLIRNAAETALKKLENQTEPEPRTSNQKSSVLEPLTPKKPEAKPTPPPPSEEPTSSTPWSIIVALLLAALGLLWLWLKKRK